MKWLAERAVRKSEVKFGLPSIIAAKGSGNPPWHSRMVNLRLPAQMGKPDCGTGGEDSHTMYSNCLLRDADGGAGPAGIRLALSVCPRTTVDLPFRIQRRFLSVRPLHPPNGIGPERDTSTVGEKPGLF